MIYLHKLLPLIVSPLGLICLLLLINIKWRQVRLTIAALACLIIFSLPVTASFIWSSLEKDYPYRPVQELGIHKAVVVLGGMLGGFETADGIVTQWGNLDRFFTGLKILDAGKADYIIFVGTKLPWSDLPPESEVLKSLAIRMGIDSKQILLSGIVENTADEARVVRRMMESIGIPSIILVTSSFHMPRAKLIFDQADVVSEPYPTDFKELYRTYTWQSFFPSASAFQRTSSGIREYIGRIYYWIRT